MEYYTVVKMNGLDLHVSLDNPQKFKVERKKQVIEE